jgi:glycosyltransferase involved in cell wall biosynthesis
MKILFCSRWFPYPPDNGSRIRIFNLIKQLSSRHEIDLISFTDENLTEERLAGLQTYCRNIEAVPYKPYQPNGSKALIGFFSKRPRSVVDTYCLEMQKLINAAACKHSYDAVIASQIDMALYTVGLADLPKILEEVELTTLHEPFLNVSHPLKKLRNGLTWWKQANYTAEMLRGFNGCTVVSAAERDQVLQVSPGYHPIEVVPNGVDLAHHAADFGSPELDTLIYSGALTYDANFDAVNFFLTDIFPLIQAKRPEVKLYITGRLDGVPVDTLPQNDGVIFTGYLDDIRPKVAQSWVNVVPLRLGGGTRLKILESLALGTPVVATGKGAEGLDLVPGHDLLTANDPAGFAAAVLRVLEEESLRATLSCNGRQAVKKYDWQAVGQSFCNFVERIMTGTNS